MVAPAWINRNKETPSDILSLIKTAKVNGFWIYYEKRQLFFTPEEFEENWDTVVHSEGKFNNFKEFKIVNPMYAVRICAKWLDIANKRNQEILSKLEGYQSEFKRKA